MSSTSTQPTPGGVALIAVSGSLLPVWIEAMEGSKLRTLSEDGTCRVVGPARLYWSSQSRLVGTSELGAWFDALQEKARGVELSVYWEALTEEGTQEVEVADLAHLAFGERGPSACDAVVISLFGTSTYFKMKGGTLSVRSREAVERASREAEAERAAGEARSWTRSAIDRALELGEPIGRGDERVEPYLEALETIALEGKAAPNFKETMAWLKELVPGAGEPEVRARGLLVRLGVYAPDENLHVRRAGVPREFPDAVLRAAEERAGETIDTNRRLDLRHLTTLAIDDERTTEVDDAFALDGERLVVLIADAASWIPKDGPLDQEAARRATTVYLPEGKIPMLPERLGEASASLNAGVDRPALAFSFEIDAEGRVRGFEVAEALCRVDERLTYAQVDEALTGRSASPHQQALEWVSERMLAHRERRTLSGALHLQRREVDLKIGADGALLVEPVDANGPGRTLVSEMMVAACAGVAQWCVDQDVAVIYRSQASPDSPPEPSVTLDDPASVVAVLRTLKPTQQGLRPGRHFTLGVDGYCQVTSPLRRYLDLINHRQLKASLRRRAPAHTNSDLNALVAASEEATGRARRAMSDTRRSWLLRYMSEHPGRRWRATVIRSLGRRWLAEIDELAFQVPFVPSGWVNPGQTVRLEVRKLDLDMDQVRIEEAPRG